MFPKKTSCGKLQVIGQQDVKANKFLNHNACIIFSIQKDDRFQCDNLKGTAAPGA